MASSSDIIRGMSSPITFKMVFVEDIYGPSDLPKIGSDVEIISSTNVSIGTARVLEIHDVSSIALEASIRIPKEAPEWNRGLFLYGSRVEGFKFFVYGEPRLEPCPTLGDYLTEYRLQDFLK